MKKRQRKILQAVGAMNMGGAETFLMNVLQNIDRSRYKFIFLCYLDGQYDYEDRIKELGGDIVRIPDTRITNPLSFVKNIENVIKNEKIDIVHSHADFSSGYAMLAAKNAGVNNRIVHAHNTSATWSKNFVRNIWFKVLKWMINHYATRRVACGTEAGRYMFGKNVFQVVQNGINVERFQFNLANRARIRRQLKIGMNDLVLLHAGRFESAKNHDFLIDVFNAYRTLNRSTKLILLGDGSLFSIIKNKVDELGLGDVVYMLGKQTNTEDYYSASDLFIMPSFYEGLPVTLIEAQMNGLKCLISGTIDKTVNYGSVEFCQLEETAEEWARRIQNANYEHQPVDRSLSKEYGIKKVTSQLEKIYEAK
jgi:glycosyltransferase involved in cell wall biosynthesis